MEDINSQTNFEDTQASFFLTKLVESRNMNKFDKNHFNDKLQEIDSRKILKYFKNN